MLIAASASTPRSSGSVLAWSLTLGKPISSVSG